MNKYFFIIFKKNYVYHLLKEIVITLIEGLTYGTNNSLINNLCTWFIFNIFFFK